GLIAAAQHRIAEPGCERAAQSGARRGVVLVRLLLEPDLGGGVAHREDAHEQADGDDEPGTNPDDRPRRIARRKRSGAEGAEGDHEGQDRRARAQPEVPLAHDRQHAPLETDERAYEHVQPDEQCELAAVRAQPKTNGGAHAGSATVPARLAATIFCCSSGGGGMSASRASAKAAASAKRSIWLCARSKPIVETGFPERPRP